MDTRSSHSNRFSNGESLPSVNSSLDFTRRSTVIPQKPIGAALPKQAFSQQFMYGNTGKLEILRETSELGSVKSEEDEISRMLGIPEIINPKTSNNSQKY